MGGLSTRWRGYVWGQNLSRAAQRLNLAQPSLTARIQQLEAAVGGELIGRTNRISGLTAAGLALLPEARRIVERADGLAAKGGASSARRIGRVAAGFDSPGSDRANG